MKRILRAFLYGFLLGLLTLLTVSFLWEEPLALFIVLAGLATALLLYTGRKDDVILFFVAGISGAVAEAFAISYGAWTYGLPSIQGVPYWLPLVWGNAAVFIRLMATEIHSFVHER